MKAERLSLNISRVLLYLLSIAVTTAITDAAIAGDFRRTAGPKVDRSYIVVYNDEDAKAAMDLLSDDLAQMSARYGFTVKAVWKDALHGAAVVDLDEATARELSEQPGVEYVIEDSLGTASTLQTPVTFGLDRIDQHNLPLNNSYTYFRTGAGVHAYVVDGGVRLTHQDFTGRATLVYNGPADGVTGDPGGHGTGVASLLGGATYGVAKQVWIHSVRFCVNSLNACNASDLISALNWLSVNGLTPGVVAIAHKFSANVAIDTAVTAVYNHGLFVVVSANNGNGGNACNESPARTSAAYTVAASSPNDGQIAQSNGGPCVDAYAPASGQAASHFTDSSTATFQLTSAATGFAAGVAALILQIDPSSSPLTVRGKLNSTWSTPNVITGITPAGAANRLIYSNPPGQ